MKKRTKTKNNRRNNENKKNIISRLPLGEETKEYIWGIVSFLLAIILTLGFFEKAGIVGDILFSGLNFFIGKATFLLPVILILAGITFFKSSYKNIWGGIVLAGSLFVFGISGIFDTLFLETRAGGWLGHFIGLAFLKLFGMWASEIIFGAGILICILIFWKLLEGPREKFERETEIEKKPSLIKRIFAPTFKVKEVSPEKKEEISLRQDLKKEPSGPVTLKKEIFDRGFQPPPLDLLDSGKNQSLPADIRTNSAIIKKTLENFQIPVEMSEVNVGPTVTQYTLKPAEGVKLSKITALSSDLSLALASHPIRIEAPIPGKPLVGIEIPNKKRALVRLKDLIEDPKFQNNASHLTISLGKDVSGTPMFADLARMPHLLVAGSTGSGKTIFLNNLILSLIWQNSPEDLRFILIDPKRVEFPIYDDIPYILCPVIFDSQKAVNSLRWLVGEMERRFKVLAGARKRDIFGYNEEVKKKGGDSLPYIVLIIDELADLMAARGKEMEAGIVRLAQMARAVGIHLVVATQRPSVEVITGLIKANITSRVAFQVASQIDSRTILDIAGAEKLLGGGDMLFVSGEVSKPKRIQSAFISDKEIKRVVQWIESKYQGEDSEFLKNDFLAEDLEKGLEAVNGGDSKTMFFPSQEDPLFEEAKRVVVESKRASASLLQRRLRIGYARAARLIDMLEEKGVVGPGEGAKPREVYIKIDEERGEYDEE